MAGTIKVNNLQLGDSLTATQNFVLKTNADGTATLARGNLGATTQDILTVDAAGLVTMEQGDVYTPAGTGAVATTVQAKLRESVSVKDFGAVGDGVTDDTAAIQAAVTYAASIGASVSGVAGTYLISSTVSIPVNTIFIGNGMTLKHTAGALFTMLSGVSDAVIDGLIIDGNSSNVTTSEPSPYARVPAVTFAGAVKNVTVKNCKLTDVKGRGIIVAGTVSATDNVLVANNTLSSIGGTGIGCQDANNIRILDNVVKSAFGAGIGVTSSVLNSNGVVISGNVVDTVTNYSASTGSGLGITLFAVGSYYSTNVVVTNNTVRNCESMAFSLTPMGSSATTVKCNMVVTGNTADNTLATGTGSGISYEIIAQNTTFTGNVSLNPANIHVSVQNSEYSVFNDNVLTSTSTLTTSGINLSNSSASNSHSNIEICNNVITKTGGTIATTRLEAIYIANSLTTVSSNIKVANNVISGDWRYGIFFSLATSSYCSIAGNDINLTSNTNLGYCIHATGNYLNINNNTVRPSNTGYGLEIRGTSYIHPLFVNDNTFYCLTTESNFAILFSSVNYALTLIGNVYLNRNTVFNRGHESIVAKGIATVIDRGSNSWNFVNSTPTAGYYRLGVPFIAGAPTVGTPKGWRCTTAGASYGFTRANTTAYTIGQAAKWVTGTAVLTCIVAGTTGASEPVLGATDYVGETITDGTVTWLIEDKTAYAVFTSEGNL